MQVTLRWGRDLFLFFKKSLLPVMLLFVVVTTALNLLPKTQEISSHYLDNAFERAFVSFAVAKSLNAVISVAQGTQIAATPAGLGVIFTAGELLDPFNDMVERFSWVMLASTVSIGIQKIILSIIGSAFMQYLMTVIAAILIYSLIMNKKNLFSLFVKIFFVTGLLRFSVPLLALGNEALYNAFLAPSYTQATQVLQQTQETTQAILDTKKEESTWLGKVKEVFDDTLDALNIKKQLETLRKNLDESFKHILSLITLFIIQTILSPLLFLYLFIKLIKYTFAQSGQIVTGLIHHEKFFLEKPKKEYHEPKY